MSLPALTEAATADGVVFAGALGGGYIFPQFLPAFDAVMSLGKLLELLAPQRACRSSEQVAGDPHEHARAQDGRLPVVAQGHRHAHRHRGAAARATATTLSLLDGIKVFCRAAGRRSCPTPTRRVFHVYAEGADAEASEQMAESFVDKVARRDRRQDRLDAGTAARDRGRSSAAPCVRWIQACGAFSRRARGGAVNPASDAAAPDGPA